MSDKRYQIFVSSTFRDLLEERQAVLAAIQELSHIPAGMEIFPADDATPWELIESIISDSDYYVLIVGGRYGSVDEDGISYTEREYDFAVSLKKPVLAFLHADAESLPFKDNEPDEAGRQKLAAFRKRVEQQHHCKYWPNVAELKGQVITAIIWAIKSHPAVGWVRADGYDDAELLRRLTDLQTRFDVASRELVELRERYGSEIDASNLAQGAEKVTLRFLVDGMYDKSFESSHPIYEVAITWDEIVYGIGMSLAAGCAAYDLRLTLHPVLFGIFAGSSECPDTVRDKIYKSQSKCMVTEKSLDTIIKQLAALALIEPQMITSSYTDHQGGLRSVMTEVWKLTPRGRDKYFSKVALPRNAAP